MLPRAGTWIALFCTAATVALLVGCSPMSPEAVIRAEERAYRQAERHAEFFRHRRQCTQLGGIMIIERRGGLADRGPIRRNVPGYRDTWYCRM